MVQLFKNKKILIIGSKGMLGSEFLSSSDNFNFIYTSHFKDNKTLKLDITNQKNISEVLKYYNPDIIINCSAYTNVDSAETDKYNAHNVNVNGIKNIIKYSHKNTKIVHISSDYVFDGTKSEYFENSIASPINYYGKTKLEADNYLLTSNRKVIVIRINCLFSFSNHNNFFNWVFNCLQNNIKINVVDDQISNPVFSKNLYNIIMDLLITESEGLFNYGSNDYISRYNFASIISNHFEFNNQLINNVKSKTFTQSAKRPLKTCLNCNKIVKMLDVDLFSIKYILNKYYKYKS